MARKPHKYHYIYKTVNQVNGKYYIGMHSTDNLNDGYIGSGKRLWYAIFKKIQSLGGSAICKILNKRHFQKLKNNSE